MRRITVTTATAGVMAAMLGTAAATVWADQSSRTTDYALTAGGDTWTADYDWNGVDLVQSVARTQLAWEVPVTYTRGADVLTGDMFIRPSEGGPNAEFVADDGSIYAVDQQIPGFPSFFYASSYNDLGGSIGRIGSLDLGSGFSWLVRPADYSNAVTFSEALDKTNTDFNEVLNLPLSGDSGTWTADYGAMTPFTVPDATAPTYGLPWWGFQDASFTDGDETLHGTAYLTSPLGGVGLYNEEFVTDDQAIYDVNQMGWGFTNLYYNPGDGGAVTDILKTPLGAWNMSWLSWLFTPPGYADAAWQPIGGGLATGPGSLVDMLNSVDMSDILTQGWDAADLD